MMTKVPTRVIPRQRHGPACGFEARRLWLDARRDEVLDVPHFHAVFTVPHELATGVNAPPGPTV